MSILASTPLHETNTFAESDWQAPGFCGLQISGVLSGSPFSGTCHPAELGVMPLVRPLEYAEVMRFERQAPVPVLLSPSQRYLLLKTLVVEMRQYVPSISVFGLRLFGPDFNVQLPRELLASDVFITHAPQDLLPALLDSGTRNVVLVHHGLRADPIERGENELVIWALMLSPESREGIESFLSNSVVLRALARRRVRPILREELARLSEIAQIAIQSVEVCGSVG